MVVSAQQRAGEVVTRELKLLDRGVERCETLSRDGLPLGGARGTEHTGDVVERKTRVLQHPDEDESSQRGLAVATLPGLPLVGSHEAAALVVANCRGGHPCPPGEVSDRERWFGSHLTT